ncbi:MAG: outer membrane protein assembly factor BamD [Chitinophagaceae bacterium]
MKIIVRLSLLAILFCSCAGKYTKLLKSSNNELKYKTANQFYDKKQWSKAQQLYDNIMSYMRNTPRYETMYYRYAYCAFYQKDYMNAEQLFKTFTDNFPTSQYMEEISFYRAFCFYKQSPRAELDQTPTQKAMATYQEFVNTYPNSSRVAQANDYIKACMSKLEEKEFLSCKLYYDMGIYKSAHVTFQLLMDDYPESIYTDKYLLYSVESMYHYAKMSLPEHQLERFNTVKSECDDFENRFANSPLIDKVKEYQKLSDNAIKTIKDEQAKEANKS